MTGLAGQLTSALQESEAVPVTDSGLIVKIMRHRHAAYPGFDVAGTIPMVVVGHQSMEGKVWRRWVRDNGIPHYGAAFTEKMIEHGIAVREMMPTAAFGRQMRDYTKNVRATNNTFSVLDRAEWVLTAAEKWPSIYNKISEWAEEEMTLEEFVDRVMQLPPPFELGRGAYTTLGDLVPPMGGMVLPDY